MVRRSVDSGDAQVLDRPLPVKIAGFAMLIGAAMFLLGGAYREQANMITTGLLLLAMAGVFVPDLIRKRWITKIAFVALAIIGVFYAVTT